MKYCICKLSELGKGDFANVFSVKGSRNFNNLMFSKGFLPGAKIFVAEKSETGELLLKSTISKLSVIKEDAENIMIIKKSRTD